MLFTSALHIFHLVFSCLVVLDIHILRYFYVISAESCLSFTAIVSVSFHTLCHLPGHKHVLQKLISGCLNVTLSLWFTTSQVDIHDI
jgi:hypothetical protein